MYPWLTCLWMNWSTTLACSRAEGVLLVAVLQWETPFASHAGWF